MRKELPNVYIHIGIHKTGSTTIQHTFSANRALLFRKFGLYYLPCVNNHGQRISELFKVKAGADESATSLFNSDTKFTGEELIKQLQSHRGRKAIISGENLCSFRAESVARLKAFMDEHAASTRIIVYVREPLGWASSWAQQLLKQGRISLEDIQKKAIGPEYRRRMESYIHCFGRENVEIRIFEEALKHPCGLLGDFIGALGEDPAIAGKLIEERKNESLSFESVLLLNEVQKELPMYTEDSTAVAEGRLKRDGQDLLLGIPGTKFSLPQETLVRVRQNTSADLEWLETQIGRTVYSNMEIPTTEQLTPVWAPQTIKGVGLRLFNLHTRARELEAELKYREAKEKFAAGKNEQGVRLLKKALRLYPHHLTAKRLLKKQKPTSPGAKGQGERKKRRKKRRQE